MAASVSEVGTLGLCFAEPLLDVQTPGCPRVFYRNVTPEVAERVVARHIGGGVPLPEHAIGYLGDRAAAPAGIPPSG